MSVASGVEGATRIKYSPHAKGVGDMASQSKSDQTGRQLLFWATNHHGASSGQPLHVDGDIPGKYCGYFQNEHGEQAIFIYDHQSHTGTLWAGDYNWEKPVSVVKGDAPELVLSGAERLWLQACWNAATAFEQK
jgi:hypothetical protein